MPKTLLAFALSLSLTGCYTMRYNVTDMPEDSVAMSPTSANEETYRFVTEQKVTYLFSGLMPVAGPNIKEMIRPYAGKRPVQNLSIKSEMSVLDGLLGFGLAFGTGVLLGAAGYSSLGTLVALVLPSFRTITVEGEVVDVPRPKTSKTKTKVNRIEAEVGDD